MTWHKEAGSCPGPPLVLWMTESYAWRVWQYQTMNFLMLSLAFHPCIAVSCILSVLVPRRHLEQPPVQFSCSVMSNSLRPPGLQHTRPPCPSPTPRAYPNSCPSSRWCHPSISSSVIPLLLPPSVFPSIRVFSNESALRIKWPKDWSVSFSISPSNEYSGPISFRMDWLDLLAVQGTLRMHS